MAGLGFSEFILLFIIGLLVLGPERLPRVAAQIGRWVGRARRTANQLRYQLEREIALADITKPKPDDSKKPKPSSTDSDGAANGQSADTNGPSKTTSDPLPPDPSVTTASDSTDQPAANDDASREKSENDLQAK